MEKYARFTRLTSKFLNGDLEGLNVSYSSAKTLNVTVSYQYNYYPVSYEMEVDVDKQEVRFIGHHSTGLNRVDLGREEDFDCAVSDYFFK